MMSRRRILVSAYACSPLWGSEPEVGWQWVMQLARLHDVVLVTHAHFRSHLEPALAAAGVSTQVPSVGLPAIEVHYFDAGSLGLHPHRQLNSRIFYVWWQFRVRAFVAQLLNSKRFDLIHHLTWGTLRFPSFLGGMGVPLVMGPLGGGESAPLRFFDDLPWRHRVFDGLRSFSLLWMRVDPLATWGPRSAALVLCRTRESLHRLPRSVQDRAAVVPDIGSPEVDVSLRREPPDSPRDASAGPCRLLFAGRLLGWKGVGLAVGAVARLVAMGRDVQLDIAGDGPLRSFLSRRIHALGLDRRVRLLGVVPREELFKLYAQADLFVFPSLHDAGGTVVLEALSRGLPVICLDLGGPPNFIDARSGVIVSTQDRSREEVVQALADAIAQALDQPGRLALLSRGAAEHARQQSWEVLVRRAYSLIHQRLNWEPALGRALPGAPFCPP